MFNKKPTITMTHSAAIMNPLNMRVHFNKQAIYFVPCGKLMVATEPLVKGSRHHTGTKEILFAVTGVFSELPYLTSGMVHFIFAEARAQGYTPICLSHYAGQDFSTNVSTKPVNLENFFEFSTFGGISEHPMPSNDYSIHIQARVHHTQQLGQVYLLSQGSFDDLLPAITPAVIDALFDAVESQGLEPMHLCAYNTTPMKTEAVTDSGFASLGLGQPALSPEEDLDLPIVLRKRGATSVTQAA